MGKSCECMYIDDKQPFVGVQFVLPTIDSDTNLCLMCLRKTTHLLFFHTILQGNFLQGNSPEGNKLQVGFRDRISDNKAKDRLLGNNLRDKLLRFKVRDRLRHQPQGGGGVR